MTTKIVCYGGRIAYSSKKLNRTEAFTLSVVEHVLGSNQFFVEESKNDYTESLIAKLKEEDFLISENLFTKLVNDGFAKQSAVFCLDELHKTINTCKKHTSEEWEVLDSEN
jgi:hypothetical protein